MNHGEIFSNGINLFAHERTILRGLEEEEVDEEKIDRNKHT